MLEPHAPHAAVHTVKDFAIHIAAIAVGLLLAIGLEQTVEFFHRRHLAAEGLEILRTERASSESYVEENRVGAELHKAALFRDLAILNDLRNHHYDPSQPFIFRRFQISFRDEAWVTLHQSGVVNYIDSAKLSQVDWRYKRQGDYIAQQHETYLMLAHAFSVLLSPDQANRVSADSHQSINTFARMLREKHGNLDPAEMKQGDALLDEHADLSRLTPAQIDDLEKSIKLGIIDDDSLLTACYDINNGIQREKKQY